MSRQFTSEGETQSSSDDVEDALTYDPPLFPRTYRMSLGWKLCILACGVLALCGLVGVGYLWLSGDLTGLAAGYVVGLCSALSGLGLYGVLYSIQYRVQLTQQAVEVIEPFRLRRLRWDEISGRRVLPPNQGISVLVLVPQDPRKKILKIPLVLKTDSVFAVWFSEMVDLDRQTVRQAEAELADTLYPERSPDAKSKEIKRLRHLATGVNGAAVALSAWGWVSPPPGLLLVAALLAVPWVAIVLVAKFQPLYRFGARSSDQHPDLSLAIIAPGFILTLRAVSSFEILEWYAPLILACAGGLALGGAAALVDPWFRKQRWSVVLSILICCAYGYGGSLELNALTDTSSPRVFRASVRTKWVDGDWKWRTWYLTLKPWGPVAKDEDVSVSNLMYQRTQAGDTVCVFLRSGAFRISWYQAATCSEAPAGSR